MSQKHKIDRHKALFLLILAFFILVRVAAFGQIPKGLNQDGALAAMDAKELLEYGTDRYGTFWPAHLRAWDSGQMSALLSYMMIPFIKMLGFNITAIRLPNLLMSIFGAVAVYGLVKKVFGANTALAAFLLTAVNPWHFMQSRWALDCNLFPHMFVVGVYFLACALGETGRMDTGRRNLYVSMVFFALCMYCYGIAFFMVPFFLLSCCALLLWNRQVTWRQALLCIAVYFGISWPIYGVMLINFMKWETVRLPFVTLEFFENTVRTGDVLFFADNRKAQLWENAKYLYEVVFLQNPAGCLWDSAKRFGTMYKASMPFVLLGLFAVAWTAIKEKEGTKRIACQILMAYWMFALLLGLIINQVNLNRINIIYYSHIIFQAVGISFAIRLVSGCFHDKVKMARALAVAAALLFAAQGAKFFRAYFTVGAKEMEQTFYADFMDAVEYAKDFESGKYYVTPDTQYEGSWFVSEVLTLYAFDVDARYWRGETNLWRGMEIPYRERIIYANPDASEEPSDAVYVIKAADVSLFDETEFLIAPFGEYAVATPEK